MQLRTHFGKSGIVFERLRNHPTKGSNGLPFCVQLDVYLDGVRITNAGTLLSNMRAADFESAELLSPSDASYYGFPAVRDDVLVLWTRGRGPHARDPFLSRMQPTRFDPR